LIELLLSFIKTIRLKRQLAIEKTWIEPLITLLEESSRNLYS